MPLSPSSMTVFILAGGLGTRLRSVVADRPKPMALVGTVPFLEILIDSLAAKGLRRFVLLTGYMGEMIEAHFASKRLSGVDIHVSREPEPLGTGGAVKHSAAFATDPSVLVNGDTFFDGDLERLIRFHVEKRAAATLSLLPVDDVSRYGSVAVEDAGKIIQFHEKKEGRTGPGLVNAGFSLLAGRFIKSLPHGQFSMERDIYPDLARSGQMYGYCHKRAFFDIGTPEGYEAFIGFAATHARFFD